MKIQYFLTGLLALLFTAASAQVDTTKTLQRVNAHGYLYKNGGFDSSLQLPLDTFRLKANWRGVAFKGTTPYYWNGTKWEAFGTGAGSVDTTSLSNRINLKLNISDTAAMLAGYLRAIDTSGKYVTAIYRRADSVFLVKGGAHTFAFKDSVGSGGGGGFTVDSIRYNATTSTITLYQTGASDLSTYINSSYLLFDSTFSPFGGSVNDSTAKVKSARIQLNGSTVTPTVTDSTISWNIQALVAADTSNKYVTAVYRKTASDSVFYVKGGTHTFAFKDSIGSGGGGSPAGNYGNVQLNRNGAFATPASDSLTYNGGELRINTTDNGAYPLQVGGNIYAKGASANLVLEPNAGTNSYVQMKDQAGGISYVSGNLGLSYIVNTASYKHNFYNGAILSMQIENSAGLSTTGVISTTTSQIASSYTGSVGADKGAFHLERTIDAGSTGPNHHGYVSKTTFRTGNGAFNSFYAQDVIGRTGTNQDHWAGFQTRITKDSSNTVSTLYDFVALGSLMNGGTATNRYGYYMFDANPAGGGTLTNQYGIYIPPLSGGTNNWAAYFGERIQIQDGTEGTGKVLTSDANGIASWQYSTSGVDSIWRIAGVDSIKWRKNGVTYAIKDSVGAGGSASPGGSDTYVQFNDGGSFGGDAGLTYDKTNNSIKQAGVGASLSGYMSTNSGNLASTTNLNPGILVYNGSNNPYGVDLGYNSSRYATRVFAASGNISFGTMAAGSTLHTNFTELMFLNATGLGIGVASPSEKLDVSGNGKFTGTLTTGSSGAGAGAWRLGVRVASSGLTLDDTQYIEISIGGTVYKLALVNAP